MEMLKKLLNYYVLKNKKFFVIQSMNATDLKNFITLRNHFAYTTDQPLLTDYAIFEWSFVQLTLTTLEIWERFVRH